MDLEAWRGMPSVCAGLTLPGQFGLLMFSNFAEHVLVNLRVRLTIQFKARPLRIMHDAECRRWSHCCWWRWLWLLQRLQQRTTQQMKRLSARELICSWMDFSFTLQSIAPVVILDDLLCASSLTSSTRKGRRSARLLLLWGTTKHITRLLRTLKARVNARETRLSFR
jgi:hypothetical protein